VTKETRTRRDLSGVLAADTMAGTVGGFCMCD
jgi:hypothetical protein